MNNFVRTRVTNAMVESINDTLEIYDKDDPVIASFKEMMNYILPYGYTTMYSQVYVDKVVEALGVDTLIEDVFNNVYTRFMIYAIESDVAEYRSALSKMRTAYNDCLVSPQHESLRSDKIHYQDRVVPLDPEVLFSKVPALYVLSICAINPASFMNTALKKE